jgi:hypothetical protein
VRRRLAENDLKPWRKDKWCIPQVEGEYVARMEDVLDLYAEKPDPKHPVVCFDESQLIGEVRQPSRASSSATTASTGAMGPPTCSSSSMCINLGARSKSPTVVPQRTSPPACVGSPTFPFLKRAYSGGAGQSVDALPRIALLYQAFPRCEARPVLRRLEFHYVPKHASWLNMVEIESSQCLDRRIATQKQLVSEIAAWERQRNVSGARIKWMFTSAKARAKMGRAYPAPATL